MWRALGGVGDDPPQLRRQSAAEEARLLEEETFWRTPAAEAKLLADATTSLAAARRAVLLAGGAGAMSETGRNKLAAGGENPPAARRDPRAPLFFPLTSSAGLFCPVCPEARGFHLRARFCRGGACACARDSAFLELGSGVTAYFKLEKALATLLFLCLCISVPNILINVHGGNDGVTSLNPLAVTTLGNVAGYNGTSFFLELPWGLSRLSYSSQLYGGLDAACAVVFLALYLWVRVFVKREEAVVDAFTLTLQDYTLLLPNIPPATTEADVRAWVADMVRSAAASGALDPHRAVLEVNEAQAGAPRPLVVALDASGGDFLAAFAVHAVSVVHDHSALEAALRRSGAAKARVEALRGASIAAALRAHEAARAPPRGPCARLLRPLRAPAPPETLARARLAAWRSELRADWELSELVAARHAARPEGGGLLPAAAAFVSFEHAPARDIFINSLPSGWLARATAPAGMRLRGAVPTAMVVESPSNITYKNLRFTPLARLARILFSNAVALLVIGACFGAIIQISGIDQAFQRKITPEDSFVKFYHTRRTPEDERRLLSLYPFTSPLTYCVCETRGYATVGAAALSGGDGYLRKCAFHVCPRFTALGDARARDWPECVNIANWKFIATVFHAVAGVVITVVNILLGVVVRELSSFEGHYSADQQNASIAVRVFVSMVFNTLVLTLLINMRLGVFPTGLYSDFTPGWYANVGAGFITQMFAQAVVPHLGSLVAMLQLRGKWRDSRLYLTNASETTLAAMLTGPHMDFPVRSAQLMAVLCVCFVLSCNLPLMYVAGLLALVGAFWADKLFMTRLYRTPPFSGATVVAKMIGYMPLALLVHLGVALWVVSSMQLLDGAEAPAAARALGRGAAPAAAARAGGSAPAPLRALAALVALFGRAPLAAPPPAGGAAAATLGATSGGAAWAVAGARALRPPPVPRGAAPRALQHAAPPGLANRGCNCTTACAPSGALSATGRAACGVDVFCGAAYSGAAAPSGWWDFCDVPAAARAEPLPYCELAFFDPACAANASVSDDLRSLGRYVSEAGGNATFSFINVAFSRAVVSGGATAVSRGAPALGAGTIMGTPVEVGRAILPSAVPLTSTVFVAAAALLLVALALLLRGEARVLARSWCPRKRVPLEDAVASAAKAAGGAGGGAGGATYVVPLSLALAGAPARNADKELQLEGRSFSMRAQPHVYEDLQLLAKLKSAHAELEPGHLALAEADGVFECVARLF